MYPIKTILCLILLLQVSIASAQIGEDEKAIRTVIEQETQSWLNRDATAMQQCWANVPYASHLGLRQDGKSFFTTNATGGISEAIRSVTLAGKQPDRSTFTNADYQVRVNGTSAFVTFGQTRTSPEGMQERYYQTRYLEKIAGKWKIINATALYVKPWW